MIFDVNTWWITLRILSMLNIGLWMISIVILTRGKAFCDPGIYRCRRLILWLSGVYVAGCAFRSFLPRIDLERVCLVDSWLSSMLVGRSVATIAEISFIAQCAVLLYVVGKRIDSRFSIIVSMSLLPVIVVAEGFSWYAVISTNYLGSVIEESLWTVAGMLLAISLFSIWRKVNHVYQRYFIAAMVVFAIGFIVFMVTVDVPMYWSRLQADTVMGVKYLSLEQGLLDAMRQYHVNRDWNVWHEEIPWMTLYFTVAVWVSIYLAHAPSFRAEGKQSTD